MSAALLGEFASLPLEGAGAGVKTHAQRLTLHTIWTAGALAGSVAQVRFGAGEAPAVHKARVDSIAHARRA